MKNISIYIWFLLALMVSSSCKKEWLDEKSDISRIVPATMDDMELLLNNSVFNLNYTVLGEISADDILLSPAVQASGTNTERNAYTWQTDIFAGSSTVLQWNNTYNQIFTANVVLEGLEKIKPGTGQQADWNDLKGRALFFRAKAFHDLLVMFAKPYNPATAGTDPGIPIRLKSDISAPVTRESLQLSFERVLGDLKESLLLLRSTPSHKANPSKPAAMAFLSRVYLSMNDYDLALKYASEGLLAYNTLIDYNTLTISTANPFTVFNAETIYLARLAGLTVIPASNVAPELYNLYQQNDLRKALFFRAASGGAYTFKASYAGSILLFGGFACNELYLTIAECYARRGNVQEAMDNLNNLLIKRYKKGSFIPLTASSKEQALNTVLSERRKELVFTGLRWIDLRRLNQDPAQAVTIKRTVNGQDYLLPPNDPRYTFPIPDYIINTTGIAQNPR